MSLALEYVSQIVAGAKFEDLIGEVEGQFFDVKSQPYKFADGLDAKREFAKDVAAFANAEGGYILVGLTTKTSTVNAGEEIAAIRPIPTELFNIDQHIKLLQEWLYPQPVGVEINFTVSGPDNEKGILVVFVPPRVSARSRFLSPKRSPTRRALMFFLAMWNGDWTLPRPGLLLNSITPCALVSTLSESFWDVSTTSKT